MTAAKNATLEIPQEPFDMVGKTSLAFRVVAIPILLTFIAILETRHPFAMFRLVTFVLLFFILADIASFGRGKWCDFDVVAHPILGGLHHRYARI
jgi:hypothetical protein